MPSMKDPLNDTRFLEQSVVDAAIELAKAKEEAKKEAEKLKTNVDTCIRKLKEKNVEL